MTADFEDNVPVFYREFYYEEVQRLLYSNSLHQTAGNSSTDDLAFVSMPATSPTANAANGSSSAALLAAAAANEPTFFEKLWAHLRTVQNSVQSFEEEERGDGEEVTICGEPLSAMHRAGPELSDSIPTGTRRCLFQIFCSFY